MPPHTARAAHPDLVGKDDARKHAEYLLELRQEERQQKRDKAAKRRQRQRFGVSTDRRSRAVQAFWAMHVEAMTWSGMSVREYAAGLHLSPHSLKKWRDRFENAEVEIEWRELVHPSARPLLSTSAKTSAKDGAAESPLTAVPNDEPSAPEKQNRRSFSVAEKLAIVLETERPRETVSSVARRHGIVTSVLFRWRAKLGFGTEEKRAKLAPVAVAAEGAGTSSTPVVLHDLLQSPDGMTAVELSDGRRVFASAGSDPDAVRRHVLDREAAR